MFASRSKAIRYGDSQLMEDAASSNAASSKAQWARIWLGVSVALFLALIGVQFVMPHRPLLQSFFLLAGGGFMSANTLWNKRVLVVAGWILLGVGMVLLFHPPHY
jgi:hypothetical protein